MAFKVVTVVGTRPEIIKLSRVIAELDVHVEHTLVHTGQNYDFELSDVFFDDLGIRKPDHYLGAAGSGPADTIGAVISKVDRVLADVQPDAFLVLGDTNSCLSVIAAKRRKIPIFHMEAGNRCFDQRVPEEINRKIVDHCSDINLTYTEHARRYLVAEGIRPELVIKTGTPMREVLDYHGEKICNSNALANLQVEARKYFLISAHREENVDNSNNFQDLLNTLTALVGKYDFPVIVSTHPRTRKRLEALEDVSLDDRIVFSKPFAFSDYCKLQKEAACVLSDSGTITEESSILKFPAVTIREAHERPEGMDVGTLIMCGLRAEAVLKAVEVMMEQSKVGVTFSEPPDYRPNNVSKKVLRVILSYTDYVNREIWKK